MNLQCFVTYSVMFSGEFMNDAVRTIDVRRTRCALSVDVMNNPRYLHDPLILIM
jgi:hypothetical protein